VRRWIRDGRLRAETTHGRRLIDPCILDEVRDEIYPMLPLPPEWRKLEDGTAAPNWVGAPKPAACVYRQTSPAEVLGDC
jgi:hypothetical protein